jgi:hypothetical protein
VIKYLTQAYQTWRDTRKHDHQPVKRLTRRLYVEGALETRESIEALRPSIENLSHAESFTVELDFQRVNSLNFHAGRVLHEVNDRLKASSCNLRVVGASTELIAILHGLRLSELFADKLYMENLRALNSRSGLSLRPSSSRSEASLRGSYRAA